MIGFSRRRGFALLSTIVLFPIVHALVSFSRFGAVGGRIVLVGGRVPPTRSTRLASGDRLVRATSGLPPARGSSRGKERLTRMRDLLDGDGPAAVDGYTRQDVQEMEDLILSLSREGTDESRRNRVAKLFSDALSPRPARDGEEDKEEDLVGSHSGARFAALFDRVLITVGDRVRSEVLGRQQPKDAELPIKDQSSSSDEETSSANQLWPLVDMMVQSKTIVKRARGELGKEGSFG
jgi:hypothetical protein